MTNFSDMFPVSLYIHLPWCVRKCPYCDFNSHVASESIPQELYSKALLQDLDNYLPLLQGRPLKSIFFGGGTPSLFSPQTIASILEETANRIPFQPTIEITLEANPGTVDQKHFGEYRSAGINRLSLGIQSLQDDKLKALGRIHTSEHALQAINVVKNAGFANFNLDLMYGLPNQSIADALYDLEKALAFNPTHLSWYQLTIEPNTLFYQKPPPLPPDDTIWEMQLAGQQLLHFTSFKQYEVSAYAYQQQECVHNRNYWEYGDYLGIGAGAHSKITDIKQANIMRFSQTKHPKDYLNFSKNRNTTITSVTRNDLIFEFMLNALRLTDGIPLTLFTERTGLSLTTIAPILNQAKQRKLLIDDERLICPTELGKKFLNDLIRLFLV